MEASDVEIENGALRAEDTEPEDTEGMEPEAESRCWLEGRFIWKKRGMDEVKSFPFNFGLDRSYTIENPQLVEALLREMEAFGTSPSSSARSLVSFGSGKLRLRGDTRSLVNHCTTI